MNSQRAPHPPQAEELSQGWPAVGPGPGHASSPRQSCKRPLAMPLCRYATSGDPTATVQRKSGGGGTIFDTVCTCKRSKHEAKLGSGRIATFSPGHRPPQVTMAAQVVASFCQPGSIKIMATVERLRNSRKRIKRTGGRDKRLGLGTSHTVGTGPAPAGRNAASHGARPSSLEKATARG